MKTIHYLFIVLFCFTIFSFQTDKNILLWKENRPLTWDDFNGKPERRFAAASTHYDILKSLSSKDKSTATVKIEAVFFRHKSWKNKDWLSDEILAHEQKHFDIVELYARKLRKALKENKFRSYSELENKLQALYDQFDDEMDLYQDKYDEETDGSMKGTQQRAWQKKITEELKTLDEYKETAFEVKFQ
ncbi:MAG: hypothetical protein JWO32_2636 [Bacteroidetes bacterium]|nr:hypothetical protein [Bacteroidota bacterium]